MARKNLSPKQEQAHTALLTGFIKKHGQARTSGEVSGQNRSKKINPNGSGLSPTVTQQVATVLGVDDDTVRYRIRNAAKLAERHGVIIDTPKTPEKLTGDQLIAIGEGAQAVADGDDREAAAQGKNRRYHKPQEPVGETNVMAKLNVIDPQPFIAWCRKRLDGHHKPMSLEMLRAYRVALDALIAEYEAKP